VDAKPTLTAAGNGSLTALTLTAMGRLPKVLPTIKVRKEMPMLPLILSSDSKVFEPPDLWQTRIDAAFRDRAKCAEISPSQIFDLTEGWSPVSAITNSRCRIIAPVNCGRCR